MTKLSAIKAPAVAGVVREKSQRAAIAAVKNCRLSGADMLDLHLSCLDSMEEENIKAIVSATSLPILALNYNKTYEWEDLNLSEEDRIESLLRAVRAGAAGIDMQGYSFHAPSALGFYGEDKYSFTKGNPREIVTDEAIIAKQCELIDTVHSMGAEVLLSCHPGVPMTSDQIVELALFLEKRRPDIIKIVTPAQNEEHLEEAIRTIIALKREIKTPISYHASGEAGMLSRIINPLLGAQIAFCVNGYDAGSTMQQIDLASTAEIVDKVRKITRT